jgi:hypothetical protein
VRQKSSVRRNSDFVPLLAGGARRNRMYILLLYLAAIVLAFVLEPEMPIPGIYILIVLAASVVLAFALEFGSFYRDAVRTPVSAAVDERWWPKLDLRVLRRLAVVGGAAALAVVPAIIIGYSVDPQRTSLLRAWILDHPASLLLVGVVLCLVALLCGVKLRQAVLLFCLTLPGLVIMPLLLLPLIDDISSVLLLAIFFFSQPGVWILLFIGVGQSRLLRKPEGNFTFGGLVRLSLISVAYIHGFFS